MWKLKGGGRYTPDKRGMKELGQSPEIRAAAIAAADRIAAWSREDDPRGGYGTGGANVPAGWNNEIRAGARVAETRRGDGAQLRTLARAVVELGESDPGRKMRYVTRSGKVIYATQAQVDHWTRNRRTP